MKGLTAALIASERAAHREGAPWGVALAAADIFAWRRESAADPTPIERAALVCALYDLDAATRGRGETWTIADVRRAVIHWLNPPKFDLPAAFVAHRLAIEEAKSALRMGKPAVALQVLEGVEPLHMKAR